jgi:hypothetical protein
MSDIAGAVWNFVNYLVSGQWLKPAIDWVKGGMDYIINSIYYWFMQVYKFIYNSFVGFYNWILGGLEWTYNSIRPYIVNLLTVWFTFFGIKRIIYSENMSLKNKVIGIVATPFLSWFASTFLSSFLPMSISLPRAQYLHEDVIVDERYTHIQVVDESVDIRLKVISVSEDSLHSQVSDELVDIH